MRYLRTADLAGMRLLLIGSPWALQEGATAAELDLTPLPVFATSEEIPPAGQPALGNEVVGVLDVGAPRPQGFRLGAVQAGCGLHAVRAVECAAKLCLAGRLAAMVTCPIHKEALRAAGFADDIGHQEILARVARAANPADGGETAAARAWAANPATATLLMTPGLKVVHLSTHKPLREAVRYVTQANVLEKLKLTHASFGRWGLSRPRIALAALNPHGGEGGLLGREEIEELAPAAAAARSQGIEVQGPIPADSVFNRAIEGEFDAVLALYHDQGHIAIKVRDFHRSATATLGVPFIRTSVDHGTAFDIAGRGVADCRGLAAAMDAARMLIEGRLGEVCKAWPGPPLDPPLPCRQDGRIAGS